MSIVIPVLIVSVIGLIAGIGLSVASKLMAVPVDEVSMAISEILPGANCGACGFSGCAGYAEKLASGEAENGLCYPGGPDTAREIAAILGQDVHLPIPRSAVVCCIGNKDNTDIKYKYRGEKTCGAASQLFGGPSKCMYGCIGFGDCVKACDYGAIKICNGVAVIDPNICKACGECVAACPKNLIEIANLDSVKSVVLCNNKNRGVKAREVCKAGCIACARCAKVCPTGAVSIKNYLAYIDNSLCIGCGECVKVCKPGCISEIYINS